MGVGWCRRAGAGAVGAVVGVLLNVGVGVGVGDDGVVGITAGADCVPPDRLGVVDGLVGVLAAGEHVGAGLAATGWPRRRAGAGDGLVAATFPLPSEPGAVPWPSGDPLAAAVAVARRRPAVPPVPPPDPVPPGEDEAMFTIACRTPGTARAVPANRKTAATATTSRSQAVPNRW